MTNAEKFTEVFGFKTDKEEMIPMCQANCPYSDDNGCHCERWWDEEYKGDTVPFDFELYQAGLMDIPKGMIEVLDKIRAEIENIKVIRDEYSQRQNDYCDGVEFAKKICLQIINKYKASPGVESEETKYDVKNKT